MHAGVVDAGNRPWPFDRQTDRRDPAQYTASARLRSRDGHVASRHFAGQPAFECTEQVDPDRFRCREGDFHAGELLLRFSPLYLADC